MIDVLSDLRGIVGKAYAPRIDAEIVKSTKNVYSRRHKDKRGKLTNE